MSKLRYLAYGSNLYPKRLQQRVPSARVIGTVGLMGWRLKFHKRGQDTSAKCNIMQTGRTADVVYAAVYEMLASEKNELDRVEGLNCGYQLAQMEITELGSVFFYVAENNYIDDQLVPFDWYKGLVAAGSRHHMFPDSYQAQIDGIKSIVDFDNARQQRNMAILGMP